MPVTICGSFFVICTFVALFAPGALLAQKFAFTSNRDGNWEIYVVNFDGSGLTNVTNNPANDVSPQWSPDGTRILFGSDRDGKELPYVMNADGSGQTQLALNSDYFTARWSQDGTKILLMGPVRVVGTYYYDHRAYIATPNGSALTPIEALPANDGAEWAPDGSKVLFTAGRFLGNPDLYVFDVASGTVIAKELDLGDGAIAFDWSPDSSKVLIFVTPASGTLVETLHIASGQRTYFHGPLFGYRALWSPDSSKVFITSDEEFGYGDFAKYYVVDADGSNSVDLSGNYGILNLGIDCQWSPDSDKLLFQFDEKVFVADADGSSIIDLGLGRGAAWSPDGERIFFTSNSNGRLYVVKPDGSGLEEISSRFGPGSNFQPFGDFSSDPTPTISAGGVVLANLVPSVNKVSPLSIVSIFGTAFSAGSVFHPNLDSAGKIDTILGETCVEIGGQRAPIFAMTPKQANVQLPAAPTFGPVNVTVVRNCGRTDELRSAAATVTVEEATPAFFLYPPYSSDGWIAARFNDSYAAVAPQGTITDAQGPSRPAKPGDIIVLFGTGWGRTETQLATGERSAGANKLLPSANPMVTFGGIPLAAENVLYVGATPEAAGLYQLAIRVPQTALPGPNQVALTVYGKSTLAGPTVAVAAP